PVVELERQLPKRRPPVGRRPRLRHPSVAKAQTPEFKAKSPTRVCVGRLRAPKLNRTSPRRNDMSKPYTGGCACGAIRYEVSGEPIVMVDCQCRQCQRSSGGGHTSNMTFSGAEVKLSGEASRFEATGEGGT